MTGKEVVNLIRKLKEKGMSSEQAQMEAFHESFQMRED